MTTKAQIRSTGSILKAKPLLVSNPPAKATTVHLTKSESMSLLMSSVPKPLGKLSARGAASRSFPQIMDRTGARLAPAPIAGVDEAPDALDGPGTAAAKAGAGLNHYFPPGPVGPRPAMQADVAKETEGSRIRLARPCQANRL